METKSVKAFGILRTLCLDLSQIAYHLTAGHLHIDPFLLDLTIHQLTKGTGDKGIFRCQILLNTFALLTGCQIQDHMVILCQLAVEAVAPITV